jgi:ATP-dependent Lon protease
LDLCDLSIKVAGHERLIQQFHTMHLGFDAACANPVVIINEVDKIPESVGSTGGKLPGAFEVLKSLIEPSTARAWTCPALQLPFDMRAVNWIMTTNSIDHMPQAFLDRCTLVRLPG